MAGEHVHRLGHLVITILHKNKLVTIHLHKNLNNTCKNAQKSSTTLKPSMHNVVSIGLCYKDMTSLVPHRLC